MGVALMSAPTLTDLQATIATAGTQVAALIAAGGTATPPVVDPPVVTPPATPRPYFQKADWYWNAIPDRAILDPQSAVWGAMLGGGSHVADTGEYGVRIVDKSQVTASTPRYNIPLTAGWSTVKVLTNVPIPNGTTIASGDDGAYAVHDPVSDIVYNLWAMKRSGSGWTAGDGSALPGGGDGRETGGDSSTGSDLARYAGPLRLSEVAAGRCAHAIFFATEYAQKGVVRYPAAKTDASNMHGSATPIPEGARVQMDPTINLSLILGITPFELVVGRALQEFGGYCGDNGGAREAFSCELADFSAFGAKGDYYGMPHLPWNRLRVLRQWDGR